MSPAIEVSLAIYAAFAGVFALTCGIVFATDGDHPDFLDRVEREGRAVAGILIGLLWPFVAAAFVVKYTPRALRGLGRGITQLYRVAVPAPETVEVPRALARYGDNQ